MSWFVPVGGVTLLLAVAFGGAVGGLAQSFDLLRSVVLAAVITGIVALIGFFASSRTALRINEDRLQLDEELAERKAQLDLELAEKKFEIDKELILIRDKLEREAELLKRQRVVAEDVLAAFYGARRAFAIIRSPMIWAQEMVAEEGVEERVIKDAGYGVIRRLRDNSRPFDEVEAKRQAFLALFGADKSSLFDEMIRCYNSVAASARAIMNNNLAGYPPQQEQFMMNMRAIAFSGSNIGEDGDLLPDEFAVRVNKLIAQLEEVCAPVLRPAVG